MSLETAVQEITLQDVQEKTPVQELNEYCVRIGSAAPVYAWRTHGDDPFHPIVTCTITVGDVTGTGEGTRKQTAKQNAAAVVWARMKPDPAPLAPRQVPPGDLNPVGALQELAIKKGLPPPQYRDVDEQGPPHERLFTMACQCGGFEGTATGSNKQTAKHGAASKVLTHLQQAPQ